MITVVSLFVLFLFSFVVPTFANLLGKLNVPLPLVTQWVFGIGDMARNYWWIPLTMLVVGVISIRLGRRWSPRFALWLDGVKLQLPLFGPLIHMLALSRFANNLAIKYRSGIPVLTALDLCRELVANLVVASAVVRVREAVEGGASLSEAIQQAAVFPPLVLRMVVVGETSGNLDATLQEVADYYNQVVPERAKKNAHLLGAGPDAVLDFCSSHRRPGGLSAHSNLGREYQMKVLVPRFYAAIRSLAVRPQASRVVLAPFPCSCCGFRNFARAFTLLEMVAVLAIIGILAAALAPGILRHIQQAAITKERTDLTAFADALTSVAPQQRTLPGPANLASFIGNAANKGAGTVSITPRGYARVFLTDPALRLAGAGLLYTQTTNGTSEPVSARVMILASLSGDLPLSSGTPSAAVFEEIWQTPEGQKPSSWTTYRGAGEDLLIQRIHLRPLFYRLVLVNNDTNNTARFSIDGGSPRAIPASGVGWEAYYFEGTVIGLHRADGSLQVRELLSRDVSYVFEYGYWRAQVYDGRLRPSRGWQFAAAVQQFLSQPRNPGADFGASPQSVVDQMYMYLFIYTLWANDSPCFPRSGSVNLEQVPQYQMLGNAQTLLD